MTFIEEAQTHIGGLIRIKTQLYWYDGPCGGPDEVPGRICLLLDARPELGYAAVPAAECLSSPLCPGTSESTAVLLFIDGMPKWILVWADAVELLK